MKRERGGQENETIGTCLQKMQHLPEGFKMAG